MNRPPVPLAAALLLLICALQLLCLWRSPAMFAPALIEVALRPGQSITLGRDTLAAPQAATSHLGLRRDRDGHWHIRNISQGRAVLLKRDGADRRMGAHTVRQGQRFRIGSTLFEAGASDARALAFSGAGQQWHFDGATLRRNGSMQPACPGDGIATHAAVLWNRAAPHALSAARPLSFGGNLHCGNRIGIENLSAASAVLVRTPKGLQLSNAAGSEASAPVLIGTRELAQAEEALAGVTSLMAGRTRLAVAIHEGRLQLRPLTHVALATEAAALLPVGVEWTWTKRALWSIPGVGIWLAALALILGAAAFIAHRQARWPFERGAPRMQRFACACSIALVAAGVAAIVLQRSGAGLGVGISMLLGWAALVAYLLLAGRPTLATSAGVLLLAAGLLAQLELGLGATESSWLRHFQKTSALLAIGLGTGLFLRLRLRAARTLLQSRLELALALLAGAALALLLLQVLLGDETGVFDIQPVELAKVALTALCAHCIAIGLGWHKGMPVNSPAPLRWLRLAAPLLLFMALLAVALLQVDDYSPLILLLVWGMAMALAWSLAARRRAGVLALAGLACLAVGLVAWVRAAGGGELGQAGFYADRFAVWLDPARHPHTGQQLLLAARAVAEGAWWGQHNWLGIGALGQPAGSTLQIPAVQDDFAPSFFINRHGLLGALALWTLQVLFLAGVLATAASAFVASERARDFRQAWLGRFRCFALCGGAAFVAGHLLLSWGTNLAIFPIMGQPMSFLSAGGSHLLFFICPLLTFTAISAQSLEENPTCRSTSNMKYWAR